MKRSYKVATLLSNLEESIKPKTKGAPARRQLYGTVVAAAARHENQMTCNLWSHRTERTGSYFDPEKGFNVPCGTRRHCPSDLRKRDAAILQRKHVAFAEEVTDLVCNQHVDNAKVLEHINAKKPHGFSINTLNMAIRKALKVANGSYSLSEALKLSTNEYASELQVGVWTITSKQDIEEDRNYYSKAWHRQYGPKRTASNRCLIFERKWGNNTRKYTYKLSSWSGNFVEKAILELGLAPKNSKLPLSVRLNKAYDAYLVAEKRGYKIYRRSLLGQVIDWVIVSPLGMTYHDTVRDNLVKGIHAKTRQQTRKLKGLVDWKACKKLGFCSQGINEFCSTFGLKTDSSYTPEEIEAAVRSKPELAAPFMHELCTLSKSLNYNVAECNA